ncbi:hypothetical protein [Stutzerimonas stutzeri]|jgi:hypothetical protein|uniref:hypothetical protein n=1 Tax=Stutzerimonas stutzeri TaxID=316 RepID=UPI00059F962F|nr:hypothetical protein [Stutzerimonas stutzeri]HAJ86568.1 hypothetical protein [Pseudomonas sp.]MCQ4225754.1 hypothetical protein [Stutzerimonas stutzeri]MDH0214279.1 hypothetical protein [Stutzerimonas stutzeri]MDH0261629.1 hypothetical protein [Stutzerimonas stutzeri]MDH0503940.1 hypothetical protein [Stutzerimonas stutzeri]
MDLAAFERNILATGFELEFKVGCLLKDKGWSFISNRYYVDDVEQSVREIDLLAYKYSKLEDVDVFTALLISCKKADGRAWALLTRDINLKDPNTNWFPYHGYSNHVGIQYQTALPEWEDRYKEKCQKHGSKIITTPGVEIFAFQEMDSKNGKAQNDKAIFSSISSLMKAQAYELNFLPKRLDDKKKTVYNLNLISVLAGDLIKIHFSPNVPPAAERIQSETYVSKYILNNQQTTCRIRFVTEPALPELLDHYSSLHEINCNIFTQELNDFYSDAIKIGKKNTLLKDDFRSEVYQKLNRLLFANQLPELDRDDLDAWSGGKIVYIEVGDDEEVVDFLNEYAPAKEIAKAALMKTYKYSGEFTFTVSIPF